MRYPASENIEIIHLVGRSHLPVRRTLEKLGIPRAVHHTRSSPIWLNSRWCVEQNGPAKSSETYGPSAVGCEILK